MKELYINFLECNVIVLLGLCEYVTPSAETMAEHIQSHLKVTSTCQPKAESEGKAVKQTDDDFESFTENCDNIHDDESAEGNDFEQTVDPIVLEVASPCADSKVETEADISSELIDAEIQITNHQMNISRLANDLEKEQCIKVTLAEETTGKDCSQTNQEVNSSISGSLESGSSNQKNIVAVGSKENLMHSSGESSRELSPADQCTALQQKHDLELSDKDRLEDKSRFKTDSCCFYSNRNAKNGPAAITLNETENFAEDPEAVCIKNDSAKEVLEPAQPVHTPKNSVSSNHKTDLNETTTKNAEVTTYETNDCVSDPALSTLQQIVPRKISKKNFTPETVKSKEHNSKNTPEKLSQPRTSPSSTTRSIEFHANAADMKSSSEITAAELLNVGNEISPAEQSSRSSVQAKNFDLVDVALKKTSPGFVNSQVRDDSLSPDFLSAIVPKLTYGKLSSSRPELSMPKNFESQQINADLKMEQDKADTQANIESSLQWVSISVAKYNGPPVCIPECASRNDEKAVEKTNNKKGVNGQESSEKPKNDELLSSSEGLGIKIAVSENDVNTQDLSEKQKNDELLSSSEELGIEIAVSENDVNTQDLSEKQKNDELLSSSEELGIEIAASDKEEEDKKQPSRQAKMKASNTSTLENSASLHSSFKYKHKQPVLVKFHTHKNKIMCESRAVTLLRETTNRKTCYILETIEVQPSQPKVEQENISNEKEVVSDNTAAAKPSEKISSQSRKRNLGASETEIISMTKMPRLRKKRLSKAEKLKEKGPGKLIAKTPKKPQLLSKNEMLEKVKEISDRRTRSCKKFTADSLKEEADISVQHELEDAPEQTFRKNLQQYLEKEMVSSEKPSTPAMPLGNDFQLSANQLVDGAKLSTASPLNRDIGFVELRPFSQHSQENETTASLCSKKHPTISPSLENKLIANTAKVASNSEFSSGLLQNKSSNVEQKLNECLHSSSTFDKPSISPIIGASTASSSDSCNDASTPNIDKAFQSQSICKFQTSDVSRNEEADLRREAVTEPVGRFPIVETSLELMVHEMPTTPEETDNSMADISQPIGASASKLSVADTSLLYIPLEKVNSEINQVCPQTTISCTIKKQQYCVADSTLLKIYERKALEKSVSDVNRNEFLKSSDVPLNKQSTMASPTVTKPESRPISKENPINTHPHSGESEKTALKILDGSEKSNTALTCDSNNALNGLVGSFTENSNAAQVACTNKQPGKDTKKLMAVDFSTSNITGSSKNLDKSSHEKRLTVGLTEKKEHQGVCQKMLIDKVPLARANSEQELTLTHPEVNSSQLKKDHRHCKKTYSTTIKLMSLPLSLPSRYARRVSKDQSPEETERAVEALISGSYQIDASTKPVKQKSTHCIGPQMCPENARNTPGWHSPFLSSSSTIGPVFGYSQVIPQDHAETERAVEAIIENAEKQTTQKPSPEPLVIPNSFELREPSIEKILLSDAEVDVSDDIDEDVVMTGGSTDCSNSLVSGLQEVVIGSQIHKSQKDSNCFLGKLADNNIQSSNIVHDKDLNKTANTECNIVRQSSDSNIRLHKKPKRDILLRYQCELNMLAPISPESVFNADANKKSNSLISTAKTPLTDVDKLKISLKQCWKKMCLKNSDLLDQPPKKASKTSEHKMISKKPKRRQSEPPKNKYMQPNSYKSKTAPNSPSLKQSITTHSSIAKKIYRCEFCEYITDSTIDLFNHSSQKHTEEEKIYMCEKCNYITYRQSKLSAHEKTHEEPDEDEVEDKMMEAEYKRKRSAHVLYSAMVSTACKKLANLNGDSMLDKVISHDRNMNKVRPTKQRRLHSNKFWQNYC